MDIKKIEFINSPNPRFSTVRVGDVLNGNYTEIESDGTIESLGDGAVWTDETTPLTRNEQGFIFDTFVPDYDYDNLGLLFPQDDATEIAYLVFQMNHSKKLNTPIYLHVHYIQTSAAVPLWKADYRYYNNGDTPPSFTTIDTSANGSVYTYPGSGSIMQIAAFPVINAPTDETVSAILDVKFYRDDDVVSGDVLAKYVDIHYQKDTMGSRQQYIK